MSQPSNNPTTAVSMEAEPVARPSIAGAGQKRNGSAVGVEKPPEKVRLTPRTLTWLVACLVAQADGDQVGLPAEKMRVSPRDFLDTIAPGAPRPSPCARAQVPETIAEEGWGWGGSVPPSCGMTDVLLIYYLPFTIKS